MPTMNASTVMDEMEVGVAATTPNMPDAELPPDPRVNEESGIYVKGVEEIEIPLPPETRAHATIRIVQDQFGQWLAAWSTWREGEGSDASRNATGDILTGGTVYATHEEAADAMLERIIIWWQDQPDTDTAFAVRTTLAQYAKGYVRGDATAEPTAEEPTQQEPMGEPGMNRIPETTPEEDWQAELEHLQSALAELTIRRIEAQEGMKAARTKENEAAAELRSHYRKGPERLPLFDAATPSPEAEVAGPTADTEAWRMVTTEELGLPAGICQRLRENPDASIATLGDLADWSIAGHLLTNVPGIGQTKSERIDEACQAYWEANPRP